MPLRLSSPCVQRALLIATLFLLPSQAFAGFQMIPHATPEAPMPVPAPSAMTPVERSPAVEVAPMATTAPEVITPVIIDGSTPAPAHILVPPASVTSVTTTTTKTLDQPAMLATTSAAVSDEGVVKGFAKQVPLAVALRQIMPAGYGFSVDPDVDLGVMISFQGGRPWRETLRDALDPAGLMMREQGKMITISRQDGTPISVSSKSMTTTTTVQNTLIPPMPEASIVASPAPVAALAETWHAEAGDGLHKTVEAWAHRAGIEVNWLAEYDYPVQASFSYTGKFEDALRQLLTGFEEAHPQPIAELHANPNMGQKILVIQTRGNSYHD